MTRGFIRNRFCLLSVHSLLVALLAGCVSNQSPLDTSTNQVNAERHLAWVKKQLEDPKNGNVVFSAHRGDWRNAPENSVQGLINGIRKGFDIIEADLARSKDGYLVIMHDKTIDRTTTGKGKPEDYTLAELKQFRLRDGVGHPTTHTIPTLEEMLLAAKGKSMLCLDKGFSYFEQAMDMVNKRNMADQIIYNIPPITLDSLRALKLKGYTDNLLLNILGFPTEIKKAEQLINSYSARKYVIMHPTFSTDTLAFIRWMPTVKKQGLHLWLNALWPEHNGGHDDNRAVETAQPDASWGWLIKQGGTIIQTDRPDQLRDYLTAKKLRPVF